MLRQSGIDKQLRPYDLRQRRDDNGDEYNEIHNN